MENLPFFRFLKFLKNGNLAFLIPFFNPKKRKKTEDFGSADYFHYILNKFSNIFNFKS